MPSRNRLIAGLALALILMLLPTGQQAVGAPIQAVNTPGEENTTHPRWEWPLDSPQDVSVPYRAPAHEYGAGHRGIDIPSAPGGVVRAPAAGVVAFSGTVVDRPLLTIEHPGGYVSTFEPLVSTLSPGDIVSEGDEIGIVDLGGHTSAGSLHLGVRLAGAYINPMLLFGPVPRAVLLPCCDPL